MEQPGQLFVIGQEVTPVKHEKHFKRIDGSPIPESEVNPKFGKIYQVAGYADFSHGQWWIWLVGFPRTNVFSENCFAPVLSQDDLVTALDEVVTKEKVYEGQFY